MTPDLRSDLDLAIRAAHAAADLIRPLFRAELEVRYKDPNQPVTDADIGADRVLRELLLAERPDYGWLSEETADSPDRLGRERVWVVDPIDGTNSFVKGIPEFAISIGLVHGERAVLGVLCNPATGELFHAARGLGAFLNGAPIRVSDAPRGERPRIVVSRSELRRGELRAFEDACEVLPLGSTAYKMAAVAAGRAELMVSSGPKSEWDVCGAEVIVDEAGGRTSLLDGSPIRYNQPNPSWRGLISSNTRIHDFAVERADG